MVSQFCAIHDFTLTIERLRGPFDNHGILRPKKEEMSKGMKEDLSHGNQCRSGSTICAQGPANLIHIMRRRVQEHREKTGLHLSQGWRITRSRLTYCELERRALAIAAYLQSQLSPGERVLLLYPSGVEFPTAFFGCLCGGHGSPCRPIPHIPTSSWRAWWRRYPTQGRQSRSHDFHAGRVQAPNRSDSRADRSQWIATDTIPDDLANSWQEPPIGADSLAVLNYTSGSTGKSQGRNGQPWKPAP